MCLGGNTVYMLKKCSCSCCRCNSTTEATAVKKQQHVRQNYRNVIVSYACIVKNNNFWVTALDRLLLLRFLLTTASQVATGSDLLRVWR